jgi:hypothetical protein
MSEKTKPEAPKKIDFFKKNQTLADTIKLRLADLKMTNSDLIKELEKLGHKIHASKLSYFLSQDLWWRGLCQTDIIIICIYLGITVEVKCKVLLINAEMFAEQKDIARKAITWVNS